MDKRNNDEARAAASPPRLYVLYAALFTFAHRARCAAAIFLRAAADIVLFDFGA
jgi:hypothetical protein